MKMLLEFECLKCGKHFEDLVEDKHVDVKCPDCGSLEIEQIKVTTPAHGRHESWRVS